MRGVPVVTTPPDPASSPYRLMIAENRSTSAARTGTPGEMLAGCPRYGPRAGEVRRWNSGAMKNWRVAHDGTAQRKTELRALIRSVSLPRQALVARVHEGAAVQLIRSGSGDGVDQCAGKVAIPDIGRSQENLVLLHRFDGNRLSSLRRCRAIAGHEAVCGSVDQEIVEAHVRPAARQSSTPDGDLRGDIRRQADKVVQVAVERWQPM